jgi:hypothetical protein
LEDYEKHVLNMSKHFLRRMYPIGLLEEAAIQARRLDRDSLLENKKSKEGGNEDIFLITTYHPSDTSVAYVVRRNWDLSGKSPTTQFIQNKRLLVGYRRPKNMRDYIVRAAIPYRAGDEKNDTEYVPLAVSQEKETPVLKLNLTKVIQTRINDFFP